MSSQLQQLLQVLQVAAVVPLLVVVMLGQKIWGLLRHWLAPARSASHHPRPPPALSGSPHWHPLSCLVSERVNMVWTSGHQTTHDTTLTLPRVWSPPLGKSTEGWGRSVFWTRWSPTWVKNHQLMKDYMLELQMGPAPPQKQQQKNKTIQIPVIISLRYLTIGTDRKRRHNQAVCKTAQDFKIDLTHVCK